MCSHIPKLSYRPVLQYAKTERGGLAHFYTEGMSVSTEVDGGRKGPPKDFETLLFKCLRRYSLEKMCQTFPLFFGILQVIKLDGGKVWEQGMNSFYCNPNLSKAVGFTCM